LASRHHSSRLLQAPGGNVYRDPKLIVAVEGRSWNLAFRFGIDASGPCGLAALQEASVLELIVTAGALMAASPMTGQSGAPDTSPKPAATRSKSSADRASQPKPRRTPPATEASSARAPDGVVPPGAPGTGNPTIPGTPNTPR